MIGANTTRRSRLARRFLVLIVVSMVAPAAVAPTLTAAVPSPTWQAWGLTVDFPNNTPHVVYTAYVGTDNPSPKVISSRTLDVSSRCVIVSPTGTLQYDGDYAVFDGQSYIRCTLPIWRNLIGKMAPGLPGASDNTLTCDAGRGPLFAAADARLDTTPSKNPVVDAAGLGMTFSLPSDGAKARTQVTLSSGTYASPAWNAGVMGKRMLMGMNGPTIVAVASHFNWLPFLTAPAWESFFTGSVVGPRMGHWIESPAKSWRTGASSYRLRTDRNVVYIGYSPRTGDYLNGDIGDVVIDPGCFQG